MTATFGMFVKYPEPGRVKTRLAAEIGDRPAADLYAAFVQDLMARFRHLPVRRVLAYSPNDDRTCTFFERRIYRGLLEDSGYELWPQPDGSLAERMIAFFNKFGPEPAVLIGSDSPTLDRMDVEYSLQRLREVDCVLGPAVDGGLYLIGLRGEQAARILRKVEWSTSRVLAQTIGEARRFGLSLETLRLWYDIDTLDDLNFLRGHLAAICQTHADWDEVAETRHMLDVLARKPT
jgi:rSAM/selenodomain-associated transferase 1